MSSSVYNKINKVRENAAEKVSEMEEVKKSGIPFGCIDEHSKKVLDLINGSEAFQNVKSAFSSAVKSASDELKSWLNSLTGDNLPDGWSMDDIRALLAKLNVFDSSIEAFKQWTDHLSGVAQMVGQPAMDAILGICNGVQKYLSCAGIDLPQSEAEAKKAMGSLLLDTATTDYTEKYIKSIRTLMNNGSTPDDILTELERNQMIYDTSIYRDQENINDFTKTLINQNTALSITGSNGFDTSYDLMKNTIATDKLKSIL